jgi:predicted phage-related endonuclease
MQQRFASREQGLDRRDFIGGSDARISMGQDEKALIRLWQDKRGEAGPEDPSASRDAHSVGGQRPILVARVTRTEGTVSSA